MKNAFRIFKRDIHRLRTNVIAIIVLLGISILPSLYAWFNIAAVWDPYGNTDGIPVAVVNDDEGASLEGIDINVGDQIISSLKANDKMGWTFVSKKEAMKGIDEGDYYAAVYIPKDFSTDMISITTGEIVRPEITYYVNEKKNGIAPKITDKGVEAIQTQVNASFIETVTKYITDFLKVSENKVGVTEQDILNSINSSLEQAISELTDLSNSLTSYQETLNSAISLIDANISLTKSVDSGIDNLEKSTKSNLKKIQQEHKELDKAAYPELDEILTETENTFSNAITKINDAQVMSDNTTSVLKNLKSSLKSVTSSLASTKKVVDNTIAKVEKFKGDADTIDISEGFVTFVNKILKDPDSVSEFMASPVKVSTEKIYEVSDYGSAMAPFYTTLAIWVGGIIMVAIMNVRVREDEEVKHITPRGAYLGRFMIFLIVGLFQAFIIGLGDIFFLGVQCKDPLLFMSTCLLTAFIFNLIIYTLTVSFGSIGKAICVIWLVLQVAGSGGTYPIEVLPQSFQFMSHFMPFTFACDAMRETIAGVYAPDFITDLLKLSCFIPLSLLLGLVLRKPLMRLNEFFENRLEDTKFMG